ASGLTDGARSLGRLLAEAAARANQLDDLRRRVEARQNQPLGELTARVLLMQAALAGKDHARAAALIEWFTQRLQKDSLQTSAELTAHAAVPALDVEQLEPAALALLDKAAKNLINAKADPRANALQLHLARHQFAKKRPDDGKRFLK